VSDRPARASAAAYVVLSHRDPQQLTRLVTAIRASSPTASVFVSHDARRSPPPVIDDPGVHVRAHGRRTDWGSFEVVRAMIDALAWARDVAAPDMVALVSGQDYPARSLDQWEREFLEAGGGWAGWAAPLRYTPAWRGNSERGDKQADLMRYSYRWFRLPELSRAHEDRVRGWAWRLLSRGEKVAAFRYLPRGGGMRVGIRRWPPPFTPERPCYSGEAWLAMDRELLDDLLAAVVPGSRWFRIFQNSLVPDEAYLQTLLSWRMPPREDTALTYTDWSQAGPHPKVLDLADVDSVRASGAAFCRKVENGVSDALLDALDKVNRRHTA